MQFCLLCYLLVIKLLQEFDLFLQQSCQLTAAVATICTVAPANRVTVFLATVLMLFMKSHTLSVISFDLLAVKKKFYLLLPNCFF